MENKFASQSIFPEHYIEDVGQPLALAQGTNRDALIVTTRKVNGTPQVLSRFGDDIWWLTGFTKNTKLSDTKIDFSPVPPQFRETLKLAIHRYRSRGTAYRPKRPKSASVVRNFREFVRLLKFLKSEGVNSLSRVSSEHFERYRFFLHARQHKDGRNFSTSNTEKSLRSVVLLCELSQHTDDSVAVFPSYFYQNDGNKMKTELIPKDVFSGIFKAAWALVEDAERLFVLQEQTELIAEQKHGLHRKYIVMLKTDMLKKNGFQGGLREFKKKILDVRIACYIVIASLSGCRVHELLHLKAGSVYSTVDGDGARYFWMRSISEKTNIGKTEWMIPEAAATAIEVLERWVLPYQEILREELVGLRVNNPYDLKIGEAEEHLNSLFVGLDGRSGNIVRTLGTQAINNDLKEFAGDCGFSWNLTSHQFRRTFANYAARSQFGDLRYLSAHFKHWSMDMTLSYALNESQEIALYLEVLDELEDLKQDAVSTWLDPVEPLAGGYGSALVDWRSKQEHIVLFRSHAEMVKAIAMSTHIRSNGHAWCTADDDQCIGNDFEPTRCSAGCSHSVIGRTHNPFYQGLYDHLKELLSADDIGPGGRKRVERDLNRCAEVLASLDGEI